MLDFAIFAVTFVIILIGAVLYLYPVKNINIILSVFVVIMFYMNYTFELLLNMFGLNSDLLQLEGHHWTKFTLGFNLF